MSNIKVLLVDDHQVIREGLQSYFNTCPDIKVVAETGNPYEALSILDEKKIDVVLLDVNMPIMNGIELCKLIEEHKSQTKVIALSANNDPFNISEMFNAGACGFVLKDSSVELIKEAINTVLTGEEYYDPKVTRFVIDKFNQNSKKIEANANKLTSRELHVLKLIMEQKSNQEISEIMGIEKSTLNTHKANLLFKTCSKNIVGLVKHAMLNNILNLEEDN